MGIKRLPDELRRIRTIKNMSLREVEKGTGISNAYLSQLENGNANKPTPDILRRLAAFYKVNYESLMEAAGYLGDATVAEGKLTVPTVIQTALMSADLNEEESEMVAQYIEFLRSRSRK